jgi:hypothetical protein
MTLSSIIGCATFYIDPLIGLAIGLVILAFIAYMNWYRTVKADSVRWIAKYIFRDHFRADKSADGLFMVITSILLCAGIFWTGLAILYLTH